jgi:hypothetical protein
LSDNNDGIEISSSQYLERRSVERLRDMGWDTYTWYLESQSGASLSLGSSSRSSISSWICSREGTASSPREAKSTLSTNFDVIDESLGESPNVT